MGLLSAKFHITQVVTMELNIQEFNENQEAEEQYWQISFKLWPSETSDTKCQQQGKKNKALFTFPWSNEQLLGDGEQHMSAGESCSLPLPPKCRDTHEMTDIRCMEASVA